MSDRDDEFDEALISGYVDGELTQGDAQRVRIHLENSPTARQLERDLRQMKETTMSTTFRTPADTQWDERPRNGLSRALTILGWSIGGLWLVGLVAFLVWQAVGEGESTRFDALLGLGPLVAVGLIVASALVDRLQTRTNDPYRKVTK